MKRIAVFGAANPRPGDPPYLIAQKLGELLGAAGYTVMTGGYVGSMEAVSHGASEAGAHVIGVTCVEIENLKRRSVVDHNHETGEVRGILCLKCNLVLGHARENTTILYKAIVYLSERGAYTPKK